MDGIIIINKPKGYTSHDVVAKVKKILNVKKVGHTGTLDPNATGVLPLLLNSGTKLSKYLIEHNKEYEVTLKLGIKTDTLDEEGNIIEERKVNWSELKPIEEILSSFLGKQEQTPPIYSAIKVKGKKLYEYARQGQTVEVSPRKIEIYEISLKQIRKEENEIDFKVACSKGTYIRSLCEDIAKKLGTIGYMKELNRVKVGNFKLEKSITMEQLEENPKEFLEKHIITMEEILKDKPKIIIKQNELQPFFNGVKLNFEKEDGIYQIYKEDGTYIGTGCIESKKLKRDIIL